MKPLICILAAALLSVSVWAQEGKLLSYTREFEMPEVEDTDFLWSLFHSFQENTSYQNGYPIGEEISTLSDSIVDKEARILTFRARVENYTGVEDGLWKDLFGAYYDFDYTMFVSIAQGRVLFEMTEIAGRVRGYDLSDHWGTLQNYMTEGSADVRRGLYGPYWRKHDRILRGYLQEFFQMATERLYENAVADPWTPSSDPFLKFFYDSSDGAASL